MSLSSEMGFDLSKGASTASCYALNLQVTLHRQISYKERQPHTDAYQRHKIKAIQANAQMHRRGTLDQARKSGIQEKYRICLRIADIENSWNQGFRPVVVLIHYLANVPQYSGNAREDQTKISLNSVQSAWRVVCCVHSCWYKLRPSTSAGWMWWIITGVAGVMGTLGQLRHSFPPTEAALAWADYATLCILV